MNTVRITRQSKGLNQRQLAELSHTPQSMVSFIETGKVKPWGAVAQRLSVALGVSIQELFPEDVIYVKTKIQ